MRKSVFGLLSLSILSFGILTGCDQNSFQGIKITSGESRKNLVGTVTNNPDQPEISSLVFTYNGEEIDTQLPSMIVIDDILRCEATLEGMTEGYEFQNYLIIQSELYGTIRIDGNAVSGEVIRSYATRKVFCHASITQQDVTVDEEVTSISQNNFMNIIAEENLQ